MRWRFGYGGLKAGSLTERLGSSRRSVDWTGNRVSTSLSFPICKMGSQHPPQNRSCKTGTGTFLKALPLRPSAIPVWLRGVSSGLC